jgi:hypothetical protein
MAAPASSLWDSAAQNYSAGALQVVSCALCGLERPLGLMVPDGGSACADLRWYCKDAQSCTERWTSRLGEPAVPPSPAPEPAAPEPARPKRARPKPAPASSAPATSVPARSGPAAPRI